MYMYIASKRVLNFILFAFSSLDQLEHLLTETKEK